MNRIYPGIKDLLGDTPAWQELARCAQGDPEAWFPEKGSPTRLAKQICSECDVRTACLKWAMDKKEEHGIWGGLTERERRNLRRRTSGAMVA